tara:strand:+ start:385 stop:657 length:273 start_codon:yes stop_codon:yes gene_type:complete
MKKKEKTLSSELEQAFNTLKKKREEAGSIPENGKKIVIVGEEKDFSGMALKVTKGVIRNGVYHSYKAGTKWEEIDVFGKRNIGFSYCDFK